MRILLAAYPFGQVDPAVRKKLLDDGHEFLENPYKRRLKAKEVGELLQECDAVISGTEPYTADLLKQTNGRLKLISRVGIGLDSADLDFCKENGIKVAYTPDAPSQSVAELTIHHMLALCRQTFESHLSVLDLSWHRHMGFLLSEIRIGLLGFGRIGKKVAKLLKAFGATVAACDIDPDHEMAQKLGVTMHGHKELFATSDLISIHIPLSKENYNFVNRDLIELLPDNAMLVNTSRGPILDEKVLYEKLKSKALSGAALDVFCQEPYMGPLRGMNNVLLSAHIGASARASRRLMEIGAADAVIAFNHSRPFPNFIV